MRRVPLTLIHDHQILASPIYNNDGQVLVRAGIPLTKKLMTKIKQHGILSVYVSNHTEDLETFSDLICPRLRKQAVLLVKKIYTEFVFERTLQEIRTDDSEFFKDTPYIHALNQIVDDILDTVMNNENAILQMVDIKKKDLYTYEHAVNTAILSLIVGIDMKYSSQDLKILVLSALLMDIGIPFLDPDILKVKRALHDSEKRHIENHILLGVNFLKQHAEVSHSIHETIMQHHERFDGSGYPYSLSGERINQMAQIIALADTYDALTSDRPYRLALEPNEALEQIMSQAGTKFSFQLTDLFTKRVIAYPLGTYVELSNGSIGEVTSFNRNLPLRPVVQILRHNTSWHPQQAVDLSKQLNLVIVKTHYQLPDQIG
jgi:HD-GYP domain-containing protein (c-di-GMP phosphodiesterase class II)